MALTYSQSIPFGAPAPDFSLIGVDDKTYTLGSFKEAQILVVIFMCNHCPYVQACWDRLTGLQSEFGARDVQLVGINSNDSSMYPDDSFENMKTEAAIREQNFPYLCDTSQEVARAYNAVCTPDIFVYDAKRQLVYHGRIDDNWKEHEKVTQRELADVLTNLLKGEVVSHNQKPSMGCSIKWKV